MTRIEEAQALFAQGFSCSQAMVGPKYVQAAAEMLEEML